MKIAVDAMGGDYAPQAIVAGAVYAAKEYGVGIILVGIEQSIQAELRKFHGVASLPIEVRNATEVVDMLDSPSTVFRRKKDSSIRVANDLVKSGDAVAVISAGHTGAAMATSLFVLGKIEGIERPAIATFMPTIKGTCIVLDVGANVDCKPSYLAQFALMGEAFARMVQGKTRPKVALLSNGTEPGKGNAATKAAVTALTQSLGAEWAKHGITVNALAPGFFPSKMTKHTLQTIGEKELASHAPLRRIGDDDDLKGAALLFASAAGKHITGQILAVDGGVSCVTGG